MLRKDKINKFLTGCFGKIKINKLLTGCFGTWSVESSLSWLSSRCCAFRCSTSFWSWRIRFLRIWILLPRYPTAAYSATKHNCLQRTCDCLAEARGWALSNISRVFIALLKQGIVLKWDLVLRMKIVNGILKGIELNNIINDWQNLQTSLSTDTHKPVGNKFL